MEETEPEILAQSIVKKEKQIGYDWSERNIVESTQRHRSLLSIVPEIFNNLYDSRKFLRFYLEEMNIDNILTLTILKSVSILAVSLKTFLAIPRKSVCWKSIKYETDCSPHFQNQKARGGIELMFRLWLHVIFVYL